MEDLSKTRFLIFCGLFCMLALGAKCSHIKYEDDIGFLNSAQANSMEYMIQVDGFVCKDVEGKIGACTKRVKSKNDIVLEQDPRPYGYRLEIKCTSGTNIDFAVDVLPNTKWVYKIDRAKFSTFKSFSCQGEIFPDDRSNPISALWQVRFIVVDSAYKPRETMYYAEKKYVVLGKHAKHSRVCFNGECENHHKDTVVETGKLAQAWSESELMRINYYNY